MKRDSDSSPEALENDPLWDLIRQSPRPEASPRFADQVLRAARLEADTPPWWKRLGLPLALGGFATAATATIVALLMIQPPADPAPGIAGVSPEPASLESLDDLIHTEALLVAAETPAAFSDAELVSLIGY